MLRTCFGTQVTHRVRGPQLVLFTSFCLGAAAFAQPPVLLTPQQHARIAERDSFEKEHQRSVAAGNLAEAISSAKKMFQIEMEVLGEGHLESYASLQMIIRLAAVDGDTATAAEWSHRFLTIQNAGRPSTHWRVESAKRLAKFVDSCRQLSPEQRGRLQEAEALIAQGALYVNEDKARDAVPLLTKSVEIHKELLGEQSPEYLASLVTLGWCYREFDGEKAEPILKDALTRRRALLGPDHIDCGLTHNVIGWLYVERKDYAQAETHFRQAADIYQRAQGSYGNDYAQCLDNLGELYVRTRDFLRAEALRRQALEIRKATLGDRHPTYGKQLRALAIVYQYLKDYQKAEPLIRESLEVFRAAGGEQSADYANSLGNLAYIYEQSGRARDALPLQKQLLDLKVKELGEKDQSIGILHHRIGSIYIGLKDYAQALAHERKVLEIFDLTLGKEDPKTVTAMENIAWLLGNVSHEARLRSDFSAAKLAASEDMEIRSKLFGAAHWQVANCRLSLEYLTKLESLSREHREELDAADGYRSQADKLRDTSLEQALAEAEKALAVRRRLLGEEHWLTLDSLFQVSFMQKEMGRYELARAMYAQLPELARKARGELSPSHAISLHNLGDFYLDMGEWQKAKATFENALNISKQVFGERDPNYATTLNSLAVTNESLGDYVSAEAIHKQALKLRLEVVGPRGVDYAHSVLNLGYFYMASLNDYVKAEQFLKEAVSIYRNAVGEKNAYYARAIDFLASLYTNLDRYGSAEPLYREAIEIRRSVRGEESFEYAASLQNLAVMFSAQGKYADAELLLRNTLEIEKKLAGERSARLVTTLNNLAVASQGMGNIRQAHQWQEQSAAICLEAYGKADPTYADSLSRLAVSYALIGEPQRGLPLAIEALGIAHTCMERNAAFQSERQQLAMRVALWAHVDRYLEVASRANVPRGDMYSLFLGWKGNVGARQSEIRKVHRQLRSTGNAEVVRLEDELDVAVRNLAVLSRHRDPGNQEQRFRVEELCDRVETLQRELTKFSVELKQQRAERQRTSSDISGSLPRDAVLVDFISCQRFYPPQGANQGGSWKSILTGFVVRKDRPVEYLEFGPAEQIGAAIEAWRTNFGQGSQGQDAGRYLRKTILEPLEVYLEGSKTLLISPNSLTAPMPWAALPGRLPGTYLLQDVAVATVPIPALLPELVGGRTEGVVPAGSSLLLVGDVDFGADLGIFASASGARGAVRGEQFYNFEPLPGTSREVSAIKDVFSRQSGNRSSVQLTQHQATKDRVRTEVAKHAYIHFSTHGFFAPPLAGSVAQKDPGVSSGDSQAADASGLHPGLLSGLVLTGANRRPEAGQEDGILTALEVAELDLRSVELATLSACETGLGQTAGGEGLLGLQRSFQSAGAKTVVASLWKVSDAATKELMVRFYDNLWANQRMTKLQALRQAQLWMLEHGAEDQEIKREVIGRGLTAVEGDMFIQTRQLPPYFWAAFVLSGDWR
jgi:CHAT domain-containing protein/tetratricopeptide (TPR) repeat protein